METPRYVLEAVKAYIERANPEPLKQMFVNGIKLNDYPESRELILKVLSGERVRPKGAKGHKYDEDKEMKVIYAKNMYAELVAAGMYRYSPSGGSAADIIELKLHEEGKNDGFTAKRFYEKHLKGNEDVERNIEFIKKLIEEGKYSKELIFDVFK